MADKRTRYVAPSILANGTREGTFGSNRYDPANGNRIPGQFAPDGTPWEQAAKGPQRPVAGNLTAFQASQPGAAKPPMTGARPPVVQPPRVAGPAFDADALLAKAKATTYAPMAAPAFGLAMNPEAPRVAAPAPVAPVSAPSPTPSAVPTSSGLAPQIMNPALSTHPDDRALFMATRARDAAARAAEPISIPGGLAGHALARGEKPWAPGGDSTEGNALTAAVNRANGVVPQLASNPRLDAEAARGTVRYVPKGTPESAAVVSNTGVARAPATIAPRIVAPASPASTMAVGDSGYVDEQSARSQSDPLAQVASGTPQPETPPAARTPSPALMPSTAANALGQSVAQTAGNRAMAITGSVDRNVVKPVMDTLNAGQNFVSGLMGSNVSQASYAAIPRMKPPSLTQPPATTAPAFPFKFNDPGTTLPSSVTPNSSRIPAFKPMVPTPPQLVDTSGAGNRSAAPSAQPSITPAAPVAWSATPSRVPYQSPGTQSAYDSGADDGSEVRATNPLPAFRTGPLAPPSLTGSPMDSALNPFKPRKKATPLDEPANQYN